MLLAAPADRSATTAHPTPRAAVGVASAVAACAAFVLGGLAERWLISLLQLSEGELTWIGDLILAIFLGVALYLWLHLRLTRAALLELERNRIVLDTQLTIAAKIQRDLLPAVPASRDGINWAVKLVPAGRVGGDYYDFIDRDSQSRIAIVGDISGKGIPAAMMLVYVRALFRQAVRETDEPAAIVSRLADAIYAEAAADWYLTCVVLRVDEKTRHVTSTNAGHPPALIAGGMQQRLDVGGPPAGMFSRVAYAQETTCLPAGARVILFTDGIAERLTPTLEWDIVRASRHLSAHDVCSSVFHTADESGILPVAGWDDDSTVLVIAAD